MILCNSACNESTERASKARGQKHQHAIDVLQLEYLDCSGNLVIVGLPHQTVGAALLGMWDILPRMDGLFRLLD